MTTKVEHIQMSPVFPTKTKKNNKKNQNKNKPKIKAKVSPFKENTISSPKQDFPPEIVDDNKVFQGKTLRKTHNSTKYKFYFRC